MGDAELLRSARNKLDSKLSGLNSRMINENYRKMQRYESNEKTKMWIYSSIGGIAGSIGGFLLGGPVGAVAGAFFIFNFAYIFTNRLNILTLRILFAFWILKKSTVFLMLKMCRKY